MLNKLKRQIIFINMAFIGVILITVFSFFAYNTYHSQLNEIRRSLSQSITMVKDANIWSYGPISPDEEAYLDLPDIPIHTISAKLNSSGQVIEVYKTGITISSDSFDEIVNAISNQPEGTGEIKELNLYYMKVSYENGSIISFASSSSLHATINRIAVASIGLCLLTLLFFFVISLFMAKIAVSPVKKAWEQQRQFVADASHELRTPLTVILANNNILLSHKKDSIEEQQAWIDSSLTEANHMKKLVDNLLFLARSDASENRLEKTRFSLSDVTTESLLQFEPVAFEQHVFLDYSVEKDIYITADITQITQLLRILIDNGCKYAGSGGKVFAKLSRIGNGIIFSINNTGKPISPEDLPNIFQRFFRSDQSRANETPQAGYGLGLAIAKNIVDDHKGNIAVTSSKAKGTTFTVTFKLQ